MKITPDTYTDQTDPLVYAQAFDAGTPWIRSTARNAQDQIAKETNLGPDGRGFFGSQVYIVPQQKSSFVSEVIKGGLVFALGYFIYKKFLKG